MQTSSQELASLHYMKTEQWVTNRSNYLDFLLWMVKDSAGDPNSCALFVHLSIETTKGFDPLKGLAVIAYFER